MKQVTTTRPGHEIGCLSVALALTLCLAASAAGGSVTVPIGDSGTQIEAGATNTSKEGLVAEAGKLWGVSNTVTKDGMWYFTYSALAGSTLPATIQAGTYTLSARIGASSSGFSGLNDITAGTNTGEGCVAGFFTSLSADAQESKNNMVTQFNAQSGVTYTQPTEDDPGEDEFTTWTFRWTVEPGSPVIGTDPYFGVYTKIGASGGDGFWDDSTLSYTSQTDPPPVINSFTANANYLQPGDPVVLAWDVSSADTVTLSSVGTVSASGSTTVYPSETTTYTLTGSSVFGTVGQAVKVTIGPQRPNILLMLVDDFGSMDTSVPLAYDHYDDTGTELVTAFNNFYRTPNMETLAANGMKFSQAYAMPMCSPTRVSLMTGYNSPRHGVTVHLNTYETVDNASFAIKSHRGPNHWRWLGMDGTDITLPQLLKNVGYHNFFVGKDHMSHTQDPSAIGFDVVDSGLYKSTALTPKANTMIQNAVAAGDPFFGYISYRDVHTSFYYASDVTTDYTATSPAAYNANHAKFATMVESVDNSLGAVLAKLNELGVAEETLIIFLGDNGSDSPALSEEHWANGTAFDDFPIRGKKGSAYEGGIRVPLLVTWAKRNDSNPLQQNLPIPAASVEHDIVMVEDIAPTILSHLSIPGPTMDGFDLTPYLRAEAGTHRPQKVLRHMPHEHRSNYFTCFRDGDWKIIYRYHIEEAIANGETHEDAGYDSFELYNLAADPDESVNLASAQPERVLTMARAMARELGSAWGVYGPLWPVHNPARAEKPARPLVDDPFFIDFSVDGRAAIDSDGDGLNDVFEDADADGLASAGETDPDNGNSDGDNINDGTELSLGLDPLDPGSYFYLHATAETDGVLTLTWPSLPGTNFEIRGSEDLGDWSEVVVPDVPAADPGSSTSYELPPSAELRKFFRIELK